MFTWKKNEMCDINIKKWKKNKQKTIKRWNSIKCWMFETKYLFQNLQLFFNYLFFFFLNEKNGVKTKKINFKIKKIKKKKNLAKIVILMGQPIQPDFA